MASSAQTLGDRSKPFEVDSTERAHTIVGKLHGLYLHNVDLNAGGGADMFADFDGGAINTSDGGSVPIRVGGNVPVPNGCSSFRLKTASGTTYALLVKIG